MSSICFDLCKQYVLVVGGYGGNAEYLDTTELFSLDTENNPVPDCLQSLSSYPTNIYAASGANLAAGNI